MKASFIYALMDPRDGEVRYIGKANNPEARLREHYREARHPKRAHVWKSRWLLKLESEGLQPNLIVLDLFPLDQWKVRERAWEALFRERGARLTNVRECGNGPLYPLAEETRRKMSESAKARIRPKGVRKLSAEAKEKLRQARLGKTGRKHTEQTIEKCREAGRARARREAPLTINGITKSIGEWAADIGLEIAPLKARLRRGWDPVRAVTTPPLPPGKYVLPLRGRALLSEQQVIEIRRRYAAGEKRQALCLEYGVRASTVDAIITGRNWKHLPLPAAQSASSRHELPLEQESA